MPHKIFDKNLVAIRKSKVTLMLNKPAYTEMRIPELSKVLMYELHYNFIKNKYGNNWKLLITDTDNFMYETKTVDFSSDKEMFDFSNYLSNSIY